MWCGRRIIKTFPSYIRHHQVASVAIFSIFLFQFFFTYFFFRTWKTWKSDCSDFLRSEKLKIGTNKTKSGQLAGMLLKSTVACYHSSYFGRSRSSYRPPYPPNFTPDSHWTRRGHFLTSKKRKTAKKREILIPLFPNLLVRSLLVSMLSCSSVSWWQHAFQIFQSSLHIFQKAAHLFAFGKTMFVYFL